MVFRKRGGYVSWGMAAVSIRLFVQLLVFILQMTHTSIRNHFWGFVAQLLVILFYPDFILYLFPASAYKSIFAYLLNGTNIVMSLVYFAIGAALSVYVSKVRLLRHAALAGEGDPLGGRKDAQRAYAIYVCSGLAVAAVIAVCLFGFIASVEFHM